MIEEPKEYILKPKDYKVPTGYQVNVDKEYQEMLIKYPTFESIKVGVITMSSDYKKNMMSELETRIIQRRGLWTIKKIVKGELFTRNNTGVLRPHIGMSADKYKVVLGKKSKKKLDAFVPIKKSYF